MTRLRDARMPGTPNGFDLRAQNEYYRAPMSQAHLIDARRFSREHRVLEGVLPVSGFARMTDVLAGDAGEAAWRLVGETGGRGELLLRIEVTAVLPLRCQRCLEAVQESVDIDRRLALVDEDAAVTQAELEDDRVDVLPVAKMLDVAALVEDELLLALPIAPRHADCALPTSLPRAEEPKPFAGLAERLATPRR
jgi:uncharacterized protein